MKDKNKDIIFKLLFSQDNEVEELKGFRAIMVSVALGIQKTNLLPYLFPYSMPDLVIELSEKEARLFHGRLIKTSNGEVIKIDFSESNINSFAIKYPEWHEFEKGEIIENPKFDAIENSKKRYKIMLNWQKRFLVPIDKQVVHRLTNNKKHLISEQK